MVNFRLHGHCRNGFWKDFEKALFYSYICLITQCPTHISSPFSAEKMHEWIENHLRNFPFVSHEMVEGFRFERVSFECLNFYFAMVSEWVGRGSVCTHTAKLKAFTFLSGIRPCNGTMEIEPSLHHFEAPSTYFLLNKVFDYLPFLTVWPITYTTVVCIKVRRPSFPRFWKNHP